MTEDVKEKMSHLNEGTIGAMVSRAKDRESLTRSRESGCGRGSLGETTLVNRGNGVTSFSASAPTERKKK